MNWQSINWQRLVELRKTFFNKGSIDSSYWTDENDIEMYDFTFGRRIEWKWDYILEQLNYLKWVPQQGSLLDWGCGSGIGSRTFLSHFSNNHASQIFLWDHSPLAKKIAARKIKEQFQTVTATQLETIPSGKFDTVIISHVLTEINQKSLDGLLNICRNATSILWVEPGTYDASRKLAGIRYKLLQDEFNLIAPCTHQNPCGMLSPVNKSHWCHHFAKSPAAIYSDSNWAQFSNKMKIDLRRLPLSYLVLDRRPSSTFSENTYRIIGLPRLYKGYALLLACNSEGITENKLIKRENKEWYKKLKKETLEPLQILSDQHSLIQSINRIEIK